MKLTRINENKNMDSALDILDIELSCGAGFRLTELLGELRISEQDGNTIIVKPCCANEIRVSSE